MNNYYAFILLVSLNSHSSDFLFNYLCKLMKLQFSGLRFIYLFDNKYIQYKK